MITPSSIAMTTLCSGSSCDSSACHRYHPQNNNNRTRSSSYARSSWLLLIIATMIALVVSLPAAIATYDNTDSSYEYDGDVNDQYHGGPGRQLLALREELTKGVGAPTMTMKNAARSFCRNFPRRNFYLESRQLSFPIIRTSNSTTNDDGIRDYGYSLGFSVLLPVIFAIVTIGMCWSFCLARCCCDGCGRRHARIKFASKEINIARASVFGFLIIMLIVFGLGLTANSGLSQSANNAFEHADSFVAYMYAFHPIIASAVTAVDTALGAFQSLNTTIHDVIPTEDEVSDYKACINNIFYLMTAQKNITSQLNVLQSTISNSANFTAIGETIGQFEDAIASLPSMTTLNSQLVSLNSSIAALPNMYNLAARFLVLNTSLALWRTKIQSLVTGPIPAFYYASSQTNTDYVWLEQEKFNSVLGTSGELSPTVVSTARSQVTAPFPYTARATMDATMDTLRTGYDDLPIPTTARNDLVQLNITLTALRQTMSVQPDIAALQASVLAVPDLTVMAADVNKIITFTRTTTVEPLMGSVTQMKHAIASLPSITGMVQTTYNVEAGVAAFRSGGLTFTLNTLVAFNTSVKGLTCVTRVFDKLRQINSTLFLLPDSVAILLKQEAEINKQINNLDDIHDKINEGYNSLISLNQSLTDLPNFPNLRSKLINANNSLNQIPDLDKVYEDLRVFNDSLHSLPNLTYYVLGMQALASHIPVASLTTFDLMLRNIATAFSILPDFLPYINWVTSLEAIYSPLNTAITNAKACTSSASTYSTCWGGLQSPTDTQLANLQTVQNAMPNTTALSYPLHIIDNAIAGLPDQTTLTNALAALKVAGDNFPDIDKLYTSLISTGDSIRDQTTFRDLIGNGTLVKFNQSLNDLPDLSTARSAAYDIGNSVGGTNLSAVVEEIEVPDYLTEEDKAEAFARFDQMEEFRPYADEISDSLSSFEVRGEQANSMSQQVVDYRNRYTLERNRAYLQLDTYDRIRLVVFDTLIVIPVLLTLCGACSCISKRGGPSMFMALTFFPLMAFFFILGGIQMPPSIALSDACADPDNIIRANLQNMTFETAGLAAIVNVTEELTALDLFNHFAKCEGPVPQLLQALSDPKKVLAGQGINFTEQLNRIEQGLGESDGGNGTQPFTLTPNIVEIFDTLRGLEDDVVEIAQNFGVQLNCYNVSSVYEPFRDNVCNNFVGSLALNTAMYLLAALCMCPGVCIGVRGYKRFNPNNTADGDEMEDDEDPNGSRRGSVETSKPHNNRQKSLEMDGIQLTHMKSTEASIVQQPSSSNITTPADPHVPPPYGHDAQFVPVQPVYYDGPAAGGHQGGVAHHDGTTLTFTPISQ